MLYVALGFGATLYFLLILIFGRKHIDKLIIEKRIKELEKYGTMRRNVEEEELSMPVSDRILRPLFRKIIDFTLKIIPKENNENLVERRRLEIRVLLSTVNRNSRILVSSRYNYRR